MTLPFVSATNDRRLPVDRSTDMRLARLAVCASLTAWVKTPPAYAGVAGDLHRVDVLVAGTLLEDAPPVDRGG